MNNKLFKPMIILCFSISFSIVLGCTSTAISQSFDSSSLRILETILEQQKRRSEASAERGRELNEAILESAYNTLMAEYRAKFDYLLDLYDREFEIMNKMSRDYAFYDPNLSRRNSFNSNTRTQGHALTTRIENLDLEIAAMHEHLNMLESLHFLMIFGQQNAKAMDYYKFKEYYSIIEDGGSFFALGDKKRSFIGDNYPELGNDSLLIEMFFYGFKSYATPRNYGLIEREYLQLKQSNEMQKKINILYKKKAKLINKNIDHKERISQIMIEKRDLESSLVELSEQDRIVQESRIRSLESEIEILNLILRSIDVQIRAKENDISSLKRQIR